MERRRKRVEIHGWLILDKPADITSNQALGKVKRLLTPKKAGHAGTLDPLATGVLPLALGEATKTVPFAMEGAKRYKFTIRWGVDTDSLDAEGAVTRESDVRPEAAAIAAALPQFVGEIDQIPPAYSAIKVDGARAYDLARAGEAVELEARPVRIDALRLLSTPKPELAVLEMACGKGAYVRSLARDLAAALGACGHVAALRRTQVGPFDESLAVGLESLEEIVHRGALADVLRPVETALDDIPALAITGDEAARLKQGRAIVLLPHLAEEMRAARRPRVVNGEDASRLALAMQENTAVALGEVRAGRFQPVRVFQL